MKRLFLSSLLTLGLSVALMAKNTTQTVAQVTEAISLTEAVDYHITGIEPFSATGSIDIVNTDHAVVIFDALKPSKAKAFLSLIKINGNDAKDGTNCQLKLYDRGAILLPYGGSTFKPLTVFDGDKFEGESSDAFTEGHSGGFMKNVPTAWNNRIRSFRLKRGYMVTFALKKNGYGYSRCFIAADQDLEVTLPELMAGRISSYRLFKWYDTGKVGVADVSASALAQLNAQTTFTWGPGQSMLPDAEMVPHRIDESWPSPSGVGSQNYSPHLKTNNEPCNPADNGTWTMEQILANWEELMRTGLRLCTPSSWDGSDYWNARGFLADFLNEIDARGWRCDIIDLHGYWNEGSFTTNVNNWAQKFKRPVWITEWLWGASWSGGSGIFKEASNLDNPTAADLQKNKDVVARILDNLNSNNACERYFYWNGERNCSKILRDGALTPAGEYFATMKTNGPGYTNYGNYVPKAPPTVAVTDLETSFAPKNSTCTVTWTNNNGDLATTVTLQRRLGSGAWVTLQEWAGTELEDKTSMSYKDVIDGPGAYSYRVVEKMYNNTTLNSNVAYNDVASAEGIENLQYGVVSANVGDENYTYFGYPFAEPDEPVIVFGSPSYRNTNVGLMDNLMAINSSNGKYSYFRYRMVKWAGDEAASTTKRDESTFIAAKPAHGMIGRLAYEAAYFDNNTEQTNDDYVGYVPTEVRFKEPFKTVPVVMVQPLRPLASAKPVMWRVWDVTTEGFKVQLMLESNITTGKTSCRMGYLAIEKGQGTDGVATLYTVGDTTLTFKTAQQTIVYPRALDEPKLMVQLQSFDYDAAALLRTPSSANPETEGKVRMQVDKSNTDKVLNSSRSATERVGYIVISKASEEDIARDKIEPDAVRDLEMDNGEWTMENGQWRMDGQKVYDLAGRRISVASGNSSSLLQNGVYIINGKKVVVK